MVGLLLLHRLVEEGGKMHGLMRGIVLSVEQHQVGEEHLSREQSSEEYTMGVLDPEEEDPEGEEHKTTLAHPKPH